ncbi:hypothetical protein [Paracoccus sp. Ld10]|uniref:hypothetical protein n=1 Tax=Paracoccus sp. Ld10 TaxID=649158 RepID=UPI003865CE8E
MLTILGLLAALAPSVPASMQPSDIRLVQVQADASDRIWQILDLAALMPILQEEALTEAARMEGEGLIAGGGLPWARVVGRIHDVSRMEALFRSGVRDAAARMDPLLVDRALSFHGSGLGRRVIRLEGSARRALLEDGVEDQARADFARALRDHDPRAEKIVQLIDGADLIAPNVAGGLNAAIAFSRGYAEGGGFDMAPDSQQLMAEAWAQRDQIEAEATAWLQGFLMLAYGPLSDDELSDYSLHAASPEGQALSQLLFAGFDRVFGQTSYDMGMAAALRGQGQQL